MEKIKRYIKYRILRYKASQLTIKDLTAREVQLIDFVKGTMRSSNSIIITGEIIKITKGSLEMTFEDGRLITLDKTSIMDIKVGEPIKISIMDYAYKIIRYRNATFAKCCDQQISNLIDGFQN